ncbi:MAG: hypothetical protein K9L69_01785 [Candidatus Omnitrophica bacterium]|nr:hypothetical protein [Candidatus Omnitrophota bacterium]
MSQLRKDPIVDRWVIVATKRAKRPNDFESNSSKNHLSGQIEHSYQTIKGRQKKEKIIFDDLSQQEKEFGFHQIIDDNYCQKPDSSCDFYSVFSLYKEKILEIKKEKQIKYVIVFRNYKVETNSRSLRHNNCNFIGLPVYPKNAKREIGGALNYYQKNKVCIYCAMIAQEKEIKKRVILENNNFVAISPFASRFPLETWILPKNHSHDYSQSSSDQLKDLAEAFKEILLKMRNLLGDFSYTYVLHTGPLESCLKDDTLRSYHWYIEIIPLLTRVAGFEWGTGFYINPVPPESAAESLRESQTEKMN